jgi:starch phosphorylase
MISRSQYGFLPLDVNGFESLEELALDLRWSWNHAADELWRQFDPVLWDRFVTPG